MQTFLPYEDFAQSAKVLDSKRLGKQRVETLQVMLRLADLAPRWKAIGEDGKPFGPDLPRDQWQLVPRPSPRRGQAQAWENHPVALMWRGHEIWLLRYQFAICDEWRLVRGFKDTCIPKTRMVFDAAGFDREAPRPEWLGREDVHASHRGRLLDKAPDFYSQWGWTDRVIPEAEGYVWPVVKVIQ